MSKQKRRRGSGGIYTQPGCKLYYIRYYRHKKLIRERTGTSNYAEAQQMLNRRLGQIAAGTFIGPELERLTVDKLADPYFRDQELKELAGLKFAKWRWNKHVLPFFGHLRIVNVGNDTINAYMIQRQQAGAKNSTINREIAVLRGMFRLGHYSIPQTVKSLPYFKRLPENNVRKGFVELERFNVLRDKSKNLWLRTLLELYHTYGWRKKEVTKLRVNQANFKADVIRLEVGTTKNKDGRVVAMTKTVRALLIECANGKSPEDFLITRWDEKRKVQKPIKDFRKAWRSLCIEAGVGKMVCKMCSNTVEGSKCSCGSRKIKYEGLLVHDMRRTAARNLRKEGVPESVIMKIGGWKTRSMLDRYNIVDERDTRDALLKLEQAQQRENEHKVEHNSPTNHVKDVSTNSKQVN